MAFARSTISCLLNPMRGRRTGWRATASIARRLATVWLETWPRFSPVPSTSAASRAAVGEDRQAVALDICDEDAARSARRPEGRQPTLDGVHVNRTAMDRIEGNRIAPAQGGQDLGPLRAEIFPFPEDARRAIGAARDLDSLNVRAPSVDHE